MKTLAKVTSEDPEAKCLVFSTWPDVLDILAAGQSTLAPEVYSYRSIFWCCRSEAGSEGSVLIGLLDPDS